MIPRPKNERIRNQLMIAGIITTYCCALIMGMVIAKYKPTILKHIDLTIFIFSALSFMYLFLFTLDYEKKVELVIDPLTMKIAEMYGAGNSFQDIQAELELPSLATVKRHLEKFCKERC